MLDEIKEENIVGIVDVNNIKFNDDLELEEDLKYEEKNFRRELNSVYIKHYKSNYAQIKIRNNVANAIKVEFDREKDNKKEWSGFTISDFLFEILIHWVKTLKIH